jgi:DNA-binding GntR family transcriptional regulator
MATSARQATRKRPAAVRGLQAKAGRPPGRTGAGQPRLTDAAYSAIKRDILECKLSPGQEVTERELAVRYGLSKAPLREALIRLAHEELVQSIPRSGYRVALVTIQDVQDIFALRTLLEPAATREAAGHIDAGELERLDEVCTAGYTPGDRASESAFLRANREFPVAIAAASGNRRLARILEGLLEETERLFHLGLAVRDRSEEMRHEHEDLIEALRQGDAEAAVRTTVEQIKAARSMVMDGILATDWFREMPVSRW